MVFGEHDETRSRVYIFSVEQVCAISGSGTQEQTNRLGRQ